MNALKNIQEILTARTDLGSRELAGEKMTITPFSNYAHLVRLVVWPNEPSFSLTKLQSIMDAIVGSYPLITRKDFSQDDLYFHFGLATIADVIGTCEYTWTDDMMDEYSLKYWENNRRVVGPHKINLERWIEIIVYPNKSIADNADQPDTDHHYQIRKEEVVKFAEVFV